MIFVSDCVATPTCAGARYIRLDSIPKKLTKEHGKEQSELQMGNRRKRRRTIISNRETVENRKAYCETRRASADGKLSTCAIKNLTFNYEVFRSLSSIDGFSLVCKLLAQFKKIRNSTFLWNRFGVQTRLAD